MDAIVVENFKKRFGDIQAVDGVSLTVKKGEIFGMIGPDGAGKTTLLRSICTLLTPDSGRILVSGWDSVRQVQEIRRILGYMPQRFSLYPDLTVAQNLQFFADLFQVPEADREQRIKELYRFSRLEPFKNRQAKALSGGMKQKLALSCALIHTPDILVLDEPTTGVDPLSRQEFWEILHSINRRGTTILISTPYMDEANSCHRVALFYKGKIITMGNSEELRSKYRFPLYRIQGSDLRFLRNYFRNLEEIHSTQLFGDSLHISFHEKPTPEQWKKYERETGGKLWSREVQKPTIEDVFLEYMGNNGVRKNSG